MIGTIFSIILGIIITIWLVSVLGIMVVVIPVLLGTSMAYVESGGHWFVWIPAAVIIGTFAWIDSKIS
jgi:hypothetical protein